MIYPPLHQMFQEVQLMISSNVNNPHIFHKSWRAKPDMKNLFSFIYIWLKNKSIYLSKIQMLILHLYVCFGCCFFFNLKHPQLSSFPFKLRTRKVHGDFEDSVACRQQPPTAVLHPPAPTSTRKRHTLLNTGLCWSLAVNNFLVHSLAHWRTLKLLRQDLIMRL